MPFRILHIDDDSDIREIVALSLSLDPALILKSCAEGADALATAAAWAPDLILCDVMMPGMDGSTMLARLRENPRTAKTPVVFMTARALFFQAEDGIRDYMYFVPVDTTHSCY